MRLPDVPVNNRFRILVVEDDPAILKLLAIQIGAANFECITAIDGAEGLRKCQQLDPHLVVTDISMPGLSGHALVEKIRETSAIPILMITATSSDESQMQGFKMGADDYIPKPFNPKVLMARIIANLRRVYRYGVDATPGGAKTQAPLRAPATPPAPAQSGGLPPGWIKCESCGYIGPQSRFEAKDAHGTRIAQCPNCRDRSLVFSLN
jgi:DNA-binding response OmpR family regulator